MCSALNPVTLSTLPVEILSIIFRKLLEKDLCTVCQVCKLFNELITSDLLLWKNIYSQLFEYNQLLIYNNEQYKLIDYTNSENFNPWLESVRNFYSWIHVRPGKQSVYDRPGRFVKCYDTITEALKKQDICKIFLHSGRYETILTLNNVTLLGASCSVNVTDDVVVTNGNRSATVLTFSKSSGSYIGFVTFLYTPIDFLCNYHCVQVCNGSSATLSDCTFDSRSETNSVVYVRDPGSNPKIFNCYFKTEKSPYCLYVHDRARGEYRCNIFKSSGVNCVIIRGKSDVLFHQNVIVDCSEVGLMLLKCSGLFKNNLLKQNKVGIYVCKTANIQVMKNTFINNKIGVSLCALKTKLQSLETNVFVNNKRNIVTKNYYEN